MATISNRPVILVCGGRDFKNRLAMYRALDDINPRKVISGAAQGADKLAAEWAKNRRIPLQEFPADWKTHGKNAGPIRNRQMLDEGLPELVVAFPGGRGTSDMVRQANDAGVQTMKVAILEEPDAAN